MKKFVITLILLISLLIPCCQPVRADDFNPGYIISDSEFRDSSSMKLEDIIAFLHSKSGILAHKTFEDIDGQLRSAAEIIYRAALRYQISPKYLLVLLQKEQSLIEDPKPTQDQLDWATGYAVCDSCSKDDPLIQKFKGFAKQIDRAAWRNQYYIENPWEFNHQVGGTYIIDGQIVTILNRATANLYIYTPHIHGNFNFWKLWNSYFSKIYPDGTLIQVKDEPGVWLIDHGTKRPFLSRGALVSRFDLKDVISVDKSVLSGYPMGLPIKFPQHSLLKDPGGNIYLLSDDRLRHIESMEVFRMIGFNLEELIDITADEAKMFNPGDPITIKTTYPAGALLQDNQTGGVFFVQNGVKHPIPNRYLLDINFSHYHITVTSPLELDKYERGGLVTIKDGALIKSFDSPQVYVTSGGRRLLIPTEKVFNELGYSWSNITTIDPSTLVNIPLGEEITLDYLQE
ncbi:MAG: hypothetical protein ACOZBH_05315 [Patescibacteria group bacterium]